MVDMEENVGCPESLGDGWLKLATTTRSSPVGPSPVRRFSQLWFLVSSFLDTNHNILPRPCVMALRPDVCIFPVLLFALSIPANVHSKGR